MNLAGCEGKDSRTSRGSRQTPPGGWRRHWTVSLCMGCVDLKAARSKSSTGPWSVTDWTSVSTQGDLLAVGWASIKVPKIQCTSIPDKSRPHCHRGLQTLQRKVSGRELNLQPSCWEATEQTTDEAGRLWILSNNLLKTLNFLINIFNYRLQHFPTCGLWPKSELECCFEWITAPPLTLLTFKWF